MTTTPRSRLLATACDAHLVHLLMATAPGPDAPPIDVRVVELKQAREDMRCQCEVPAQWMIRTHEVAG